MSTSGTAANSAGGAHGFRYLRDPVFLACVAIYGVNRLALRPLCSGDVPFLQWYLNDLLCLPFWLPPILWIHRRVGIRRHDGPPTFGEIYLHLAIFSAFFEVAAPAMSMFQGRPVADPVDVLCYTVGAFVAATVWGRRAAQRPGHLSASE